MRIPASFTLDGIQITGWLAPADDHFPPMVYQVFINNKWLGNLSYTVGCHIGLKEYDYMAETLGGDRCVLGATAC